jgi:glycosyltransferase involved in cell wall biosynthesis
MLALGARSTLRSLQREGFDFDVIDAHYYYPDGVAAALLARWFKKPLFITARGTDLNLISNFASPRRWIQWAASVASSSIGVSQSLVDKLISLGGDPSRTHVVRNGVDLERFHPVDQAKARNDLGLPMDRRVLLSVGHLVSIKGHDIAIQALADMPEADLAIVGEGPERSSLQELAHSMGVTNRIRFAGARPQTELPLWYSAADALVLCSSREGWANVLLESMACSTPVVATNVGGTAEALSAPEAGVLMQDRSPAGLVAAVGKLFASYPERKMVRQFAEQFDWQATTRGQLALFQAAVAAQQSGLRQYA